MKIGIILHPYGEKMPGGLPRIISGWTEALLSADRENEYIIFVKEKPEKPPVFPGKNWRLEVLGTGRFWLDRLRKFPLADVYLFNTPVLPFFWKPPRSVIIALDYPYKYLPAKNFKTVLFRKFISWYHRRSLRKADHIIAVSHSTKNDTIKFFGIPSEKISVVYHGFKKICELPELAISLPEKFFFFAGTMKERKNVLNIIKGFGFFFKKFPDAKEHLVLGGKNEGEYYDMLARYISENKLSDRVHFTGHLNENQLSFAYRRASALVFPSIVEGTGFPILEAMSCGIPVITSNIFGPAELGGNGAAILINPYKPEEIAGGMERIVFEPMIKDILAKKAEERLKHFSWENTGKETLAILEKIAAGTAAADPTRKSGRLRITFIVHNTKPHNGGGVLAHNIIEKISAELSADIEILTSEKSGFFNEYAVLSARWFLSPKKVWKIFTTVRHSDVVHAFDVFPYGFIAMLFSVGSRAKLIITANGTGSIRYLYMPFIAPLVKFAYRKADKVVAISKFTRDEILKKVSGVSIDVINPGIDLSVFGVVPKPEFTEKIKKYQPYILSVGSLRFRKGYRWSIPVFKKVSEKFPDLRYVIIGKKYTDKEHIRLKKIIADLDLVDKVFLVEDVATDEELAAFYHGAELFYLMSFNVGHDVEGFGIVFIEAAAAGIPVVGSKNCGAEDAVANGKNGLLAAENDISGFSDAIVSILGDKQGHKAMSNASIEFVKDFDWEKKITEYICLYRSLL